MFTGIIEQIGKVISVDDRRHQRRILIQTDWDDLKAGEPIAVNGISLLVSSVNAKREMLVLVNEEMLERSTLTKLAAESKVNLERAPTLATRLGGHYVQGTVDSKGLVLNITEHDGQRKLTVALDSKYGRYCIERGWIAIEGMSLKIHSLIQTKLNEFMITCLVPNPLWKNSAFATLKIADAVNVEVDVLAKYIERLSPQLEGFAVAANPFTLDSVRHLVVETPMEADAAVSAQTAAEHEASLTETSSEPVLASEPASEEAILAAETIGIAEAQPEVVAQLHATDIEAAAGAAAFTATSEEGPAPEDQSEALIAAEETSEEIGSESAPSALVAEAIRAFEADGEDAILAEPSEASPPPSVENQAPEIHV